MTTWTIRALYPSGEVVEQYATEAEARAALDRHRGRAASISFTGPAGGGPKPPDRCSFCGKSLEPVKRLIAGPACANVAICDE